MMCLSAVPVHVCVFGRVTGQKETGVWECLEKTWPVCTLLKTLWAGTMGYPAANRYASDFVTTLQSVGSPSHDWSHYAFSCLDVLWVKTVCLRNTLIFLLQM